MLNDTTIPVELYSAGKTQTAFLSLVPPEMVEVIRPDIAHILHGNELQRYYSFPGPARKDSYLLGRYAAKKALGNLVSGVMSELCIETGSQGQPELLTKNTPDFNVSISHCNQLVAAIAFNRQFSMAVDVEWLNPARKELLMDELSGNLEVMNTLEGIGDERKLLLLWTIKEAVSKIVGTGIGGDHSMLDICAIEYDGEKFSGEYKEIKSSRFVSYLGKNMAFTLVYPANTSLKMINPLTGIRMD